MIRKIMPHKFYILFLSMVAVCFPSLTHAYDVADGAGLPEGGTYDFMINMNALSFPSNKPGSQVIKPFSVSASKKLVIYCSIPRTTLGVTYSMRSSMPVSSDTGYLYLNEYLDVDVQIWVAGNLKQYQRVPTEVWNMGSTPYACKPPGILTTTILETGSQGKITFYLKKPIINGLEINQSELVQVFARAGKISNATAYDRRPSTRVILNSMIITVPDKCVVNEGTPITVEFGSVANTSDKLNGNNYVQNVPIRVQCTGGSFDTGNVAIKLGIQPAGSGVASFNSDYLGTTGVVDRSNLGISLKDTSGNPVIPNHFYDIPGFINNRGTWNLTAAPIAAPGSSVAEGEFSANATVVAQFQ